MAMAADAADLAEQAAAKAKEARVVAGMGVCMAAVPAEARVAVATGP